MPDLISQKQAMATMAALSPENSGLGKKIFGLASRACGRALLSGSPDSVRDVILWESGKACSFVATFSVPSGIYVAALAGGKDPDEEHLSPRLEAAPRSSLFAETPPAKTMDLVSGCCSRARLSFSSKMSMAVFWKLAAKSEICLGVSKFFKS